MNGFEGTLFETFLMKLVPNQEQHARYVNTLSMLEYMGARKIFKSQRSETISLALLSHASDEIRHAKLLKRAALELSDGRLDSFKDEHLLCGHTARRYFQTVDRLSESQGMNVNDIQRYALTTWLVEKRVLTLYPAYETVLSLHKQFSAQQTVIRAILKDEERHLSYVDHALSQKTGISELALETLGQCEENEFRKLVQAWLMVV